MPLTTRLLPALAALFWVCGQLQDRPQDKTASFERKGDYVGDVGTCNDCHEEQVDAIKAGVHKRVPTSKLLRACETCHGPGAQHAEDNDAAQITMPPKLSAKRQRALCGTCHADQILDHGGPMADLLLADKRCTTCHTVHQAHKDIPGADDARSFAHRSEVAGAAKPAGMKVCLTCHTEKAKTLEAGTHRPLLDHKGSDWKPEQSCEACHGNGSLHVASNGIARLITRPDVAADGDATCISCHDHVDSVHFHWGKGHGSLLGGPNGTPLRCTTCHVVHHGGDPTRARTSTKPRPTSRPSRAQPTSQGVDRSQDATVRPGACMACHAPAYDVLVGTVHEALAKVDGPTGTGCIDCHPGAGAHAKSGGHKALVVSMRGATAGEQAKSCMQCHERNHKVCGYSLGSHAKAGVACLTCHSPAAPRDPAAWKRDAHKACASCHGDVALSFRHGNAHPVGKGSFTCSSCHDPHTPRATGIRAGRRLSATCKSCHREHRGPFVFQHNADKSRGCMACHVPHGSSNRKLLDKRRARDNCLSCHADLPSFHDQSPGSQFRNCLNCHTQIHGSNRNRFFFR